MLRDLIRRKREPSPPISKERVPDDEQKVTKHFIFRMVLILAIGVPATAAFVSPFIDQAIRNKVYDWMSIPDLFDSISIRPDEYAKLPTYWRQALAEIALRPKEEAVDAQTIITGLKVADMELIGLLAPYATSLGILRENGQLSEHPMPELSYVDFSHLQDLGILEDVNDGMKFDLSKTLNSKSEVNLIGTTVVLKFKAKRSQTNFALEATAFTKGGKQLMDALRVPSNIAYFEWFAKKLEENGLATELFVNGIRENRAPREHEVQVRIDRHSIPSWPLQEED